ncbi:Serine/threonine protein kinase [Stigmatella aurantiaca]|uniref:Serine/threonine protein kinase n=1 Tax=Stigmatella aurantiaca TaxID=41 RepID=A0A1H7RL78_STIAU|nr:serine/threonine-protein kinase [Stigmatella aurantiaca]SEL60157.1 Serine/threonine protein kinase [Stigmatella aurantiaca]
MNELSPEALPPGTLVGSWRVDACVGYGTYGVVYRTYWAGQTEGPPVALKLARHPGDPRFDREAELLTRVQHPSVPRLLGRGRWQGRRKGSTHPYLALEWVEGLRLYEWAQEHPFRPYQPLRWLAQVARGLEATHACGGLHRDVKGDNVMVGPGGQAFLMDFGCGTWEGATPLTEGPLAPGTRIYRSPQALRFHWNHRRSDGGHYEATPADDVYALGVMAYRLWTGVYPPLATDPSIMGDDGRDTLEVRVPPGKLTPLAPEVEALILRMLSENPWDRGSAAELAATMEDLVAATEATERIPMRCPTRAQPDAGASVAFKRRAGIGAVLLTAAMGLTTLSSDNWSVKRLQAFSSSMQDGGTGGVADAAVESALMSIKVEEPHPKGLSLDMPKEPLPGQRRPPCPRPEISIRGGCWIEVARTSPPCGEGYVWKDACYYPVPAPLRPNTSEKP